ncbi:MAG: hypothetical protein JWL90_3086 [Chthoniobacteraceae bacterium]|nr:hypothetical protein [Chthoniobacteraceae bacterium]MDB6174512.1 hypothetical protein [Chthoniobacteraceae bacterium]
MITPNEGIGTETRAGSIREPEMFRATVDKPFARVSWGAIFAGALTALSCLLVLSLLGLGIGLSTLDPVGGSTPSGDAIGIGAVIWWVVSSLISLFIGGYVAGRMAGNFNGYLHGLVTWSVVSLLTVVLLSSAAGRIFAGASGLAQFAVRAPSMMPGLVAPLRDSAQGAMDRLEGAAADPATRARTEEQTRDLAQKAAKGSAMGSFGAALALILGAGAASFGGVVGKRRFLSVVPERKEFLSTSRL